MRIFKIVGVTVAAAASLISVSANASVVDLNVGSDAFRLAVSGPLPQNEQASFDVGGIVHSEKHRDATALHGGVLLTGDTGSEELKVTAGLGLRAQYVDVESDQGGGVAVGGEVHARIPGLERLDFSGYGYYQPNILALGDVDEQTEWGLSAGYEVIRGGSVYVGYRELRADIGGGNDMTTLDDGFHVGLRLNF